MAATSMSAQRVIFGFSKAGARRDQRGPPNGKRIIEPM